LERGVRRFGKITARFATVAIDDVPFLNLASIHVDLESRTNGQCRSFLLTLIRFTYAITGHSRVMLDFPTSDGRDFLACMEREGILIKDETHPCRWLSTPSYPMEEIIAW
jgi:hypothetical protein